MYYLWMYFEERVKDFYLPNARNWTGDLLLTQSDTGWDEDAAVHVRALDGIWFVGAAPGFKWQGQAEATGEMRMSDGGRFVMSNDVKSIGIVVSEYKIHNTQFAKYAFPAGSRVSVGRGQENTIWFDDKLVTSLHGELVRQRDGSCVYRDKSRNGSYVNGYRLLNDTREMVFGDIITLATGLKIVYLGELIAISKPDALKKVDMLPFSFQATKRDSEGVILPRCHEEYQRAPRLLTKPDTTAVEIEPPLAKQSPNAQPLILTLGPSMTMILPMLAGTLASSLAGGNRSFMLAGITMIGMSSLLAVAWGTVNFRYKRKHSLLTERKRMELYRRYIKETESKLKSFNQAERSRLMENFISAKQCAALPGNGTYRLWERMPSHDDFLRVRLGVGDVPLCNPIQIQTKKLSFIDDPLRDEAERLRNTYANIENAPIVASLRDSSIIGILGSEEAARLGQSVIVQIAALHSYSDVKICVLYDESNRSQWAWTRWLPHVFASDDRQMRMSVCKPAAVHEVVSYIDEVLRMRMENLADRRDDENAAQILPHYVIVSTKPDLIDDKMIFKRLLQRGLGFTIVLLAKRMEQLPKECALIVNTKSDSPGVFTSDGSVTRLSYETLKPDAVESFAKKIAPIRVSDIEENISIPAMAPFLRTYGARRVEDIDVWRFWNENMAYDGLRSIIGLKAGGQPFILDISDRFHGPHGLVAGTTGAGKSVMLQTYILSLALNYHPRQVQFILIDYKGGGMANTFKDLPHVAGLIDNLQSERTILRALASIQGEIRRREAVFKRVSVNNIDEYMRLFHADPDEEPIPHLVIIVDEFAELKKEKPEFMRELVSASRVGRSVGVHLILATQKPSNSVDDEIWSNTRFRICLRVAGRGDSMDMLKRPDAAYIKGMGRCYVQIGSDELFEQVQTLYSGLKYNPDAEQPDAMPRLLNDMGAPIAMKGAKRSAGKREVTQMDAVLERITRVAGQRGVKSAKWLWKEEIKPIVFLSQIDEFNLRRFDGADWPANPEREIKAVIGLADDVTRQRHIPVWVDFTKNRSHMFIGMATTGKTTLLQTLAMSLAERYSPANLQMYIFSLSSRTLGCLEGLPHVGGIVYEEETQEQLRLMNMLEIENDRRRRLFARASTDSFIEYCRACDISGDLEPVAAIVVFIDRMAQIREIFSDEDIAKLYALMRESSGRGIFFAVSAMSLNEVPLRVQGGFYNMVLEMRERADYSDILGRRVPLEMSDIERVKGRGLARMGDELMEMQTALFGDKPGDVERAQVVAARAEAMRAAWTGQTPAKLARIPENASWRDLMSDFARTTPKADAFALPIGYLMLEGLPAVIDLKTRFSWLVTGAKGSGKTSFLRGVAASFAAAGAQIHVVADESRRAFTGIKGCDVCQPKSEELDNLVISLHETTLNRAAQRKQALLVSDAEEERVVAAFTPIAVIIDDLDDAIEKLPPTAIRYFATACSSAARFGIYTFAAISHQGIPRARAKELFVSLAQRQCGVAIGGKLSECDVFSTQFNFQQRGMSLPLGQAWLIRDGVARKMLIPGV